MNGAKQAELADLLIQVRSVQLNPYEGRGPATLSGHLIPQMRELLDDVLASLADLEAEAYRVASEEPGSVGAPHGPSAATAASLSDVCFVALAELRPLGKLLAELGEGASLWACLTGLERALDALEQALRAAELELAAFLHAPPKTSSTRQVPNDLVTRRACGMLRRHVSEASQAHEEDVEGFLRSVGTALVRFRGRDEFADVGITDRLMVTALRDRILTWLRSPERDAVGGGRLADEVLVFIRFLNRVNHLPEIVAHDVGELSFLSEALLEHPADEPVPEGLRSRLRGLLGRDDKLDDKILDGASVGDLLPVAREVRGRLEGKAAAPFPGVEAAPDASVDPRPWEEGA